MSKTWENELMKALRLIRDFRLKSIDQNIDPRATRVAIKYMLLVDGYVARKHGLTNEEDEKLTEMARDLFRETPQIKRAGGF